MTFHAPGSILTLGKDVLAFFKLWQYFILATIPVEAVGLVVPYCYLPVGDYAAYCGGTFVAPVTNRAGQAYLRNDVVDGLEDFRLLLLLPFELQFIAGVLLLLCE